MWGLVESKSAGLRETERERSGVGGWREGGKERSEIPGQVASGKLART